MDIKLKNFWKHFFFHYILRNKAKVNRNCLNYDNKGQTCPYILFESKKVPCKNFFVVVSSSSYKNFKILLIEICGGKVKSITQIYGLCTLINLWYEQIWIDDSVQVRSHNSISLHQISGKKVFFVYRSFKLSC